MSLSRFIWSNRKALFSVVIMLCVVGGYFATHLPVAIFPQLLVPRILVAADAGDIPIDMTLVSVTRPLEAAVSTVPGVSRVSSATTRGSADLDVTFDWGTNMQIALQRLQSQVSDVRPTLPQDANVTTALVNPSIFPIMGYSLTSDRHDLTFLRNLALYTLRPRLARLPGVAQVRITGGDVPEYRVAVRAEALAAHGLTLQDVQDALARANSVTSVGVFDRSYQRFEILVSGLLHGPEDIASVTVATHGEVPIAIADLATVTRSIRPRTVLATGDGHPAVIINIVKQPAANTIAVADEVRRGLLELQGAVPAGVKTDVFYDQSEIVRQSEASVIEAIAVGGTLAMIVLFLFLGNLRAAAVVVLVVPLTLLITFAFMKAMGQTLNIMTLGAVAIALGLVIDDGIVVVEDIFAGLEEGQSRRQAIARGLHAITPGMLGSSLTTMAAFLPLTVLTGVPGQFFAPLAIVLMSTLFVSLVLALLLIPLFAEFLLPARVDVGAVPSRLERFLAIVPSQTERLGHAYARFLARCLERRRWILLGLVPLVAASMWLYGRLETGFFPEFDEGAFVIDYFTPKGTSLDETDRICHQVENMLGKTPEVAAWSRLTGARSGSGLELSEPNQGDILVRLKTERTRSADDVMDDIREQLDATLPGFKHDLIQILQDGLGDIAGAPQPIEVKIFGEDPVTLRELAHQAGDIVGKVKGVVDESDGIVETGPEAVVRVDSQAASRFGMSTREVTAGAMAAIRGAVATSVQEGEQSVDVRVQAWRPTEMLDPQALPDLLLAAPGNVPLRTVRLRQVARLTENPGTAQLTRENQQPMVAVTARLEGRDLGSGVAEVQKQLADLPLPAGYRIEYGGLYASQQQSFAELAVVLILAVMLISALLLIQFRSFRQVIALMVAALLSQSGVLLALFVTHTQLNISSFTGAIMIIGVITENGVFMFDSYNVLRRARPGRSVEENIVEAGRLRLRPILMTKIGAILALLPLALGFGAGAAMQQPLAIAVVGGLSMATIFTLIVAPTLFVSMEHWQGPLIRLWERAEVELQQVDQDLQAP